MVKDKSSLSKLFDLHADFSRIFLDAFVVIDQQKKIARFNQLFCSLVSRRASDIKPHTNLEELLKLEFLDDELNPVALLLESDAPMRLHDVVAIVKEEQLRFVLSSYPLKDSLGVVLGHCILLRDTTAEIKLEGKYQERTLQSITDPLTGLYTRRFFEDWIEKELHRTRSVARPIALGVMMLDLDEFKKINDTYGHLAGDHVLKETANVLRTMTRRADILGRFGGEEIIVLLLGANARGAAIAAEKFRQGIENHDYTFKGQKLTVTASVGVTLFFNNSEDSKEVITRADKCMYAAKEAGRNCVFGDFGKGACLASQALLE